MTAAAPTAREPIAAPLVALLTACVAFQLNASMLSPALVTMARELDTTLAVVSLSQTWFFTAAALFALFLPRLSDIAGRRRVLTFMMAAMVVGAGICALTPNVAGLFVGRIVQGACGPTVPLSLLMLRSAIDDPKRLGTMMGVVAAVNGGVAGIDAFLGGWLAQTFGFRSLFWSMAALGLVAIVAVRALTRESAPSAGTRMDWAGVAYLVVGVGAVLTGLNELTAVLGGEGSGSLIALTLALFVVGALALVAFWRSQGHGPHPMVGQDGLRRRATWATLATTTLTMTGVFAVINGIVPAYVQATRPGFGIEPAAMSLLILTPYAIIGWVVGPFAGRFAATIGYKRLLRLGLVGSVAALAVMATAGLASLPVMVAAAVALGVAYAGTVNIVLNNLGVVHSPRGNPGFLPGMNSGAFNLGAGLSFLILPAVQAATGGEHAVGSYVASIGVGAAVTCGAFAMSYLIPTPVHAEEHENSPA